MHQLAQMNVARTRAGCAESLMSGLTHRIAEMNALAEASPGFVWRYDPPAKEGALLQPLAAYCAAPDLTRLFFNMSVWESLDALRGYVFRTVHREMLWGKEQWVDPMDQPSLALWWVPAGHLPSIPEAWDRLQHLGAAGPTASAFTFAQPFPPP